MDLRLEPVSRPVLATHYDSVGRRQSRLRVYGLGPFGSKHSQIVIPPKNPSRSQITSTQKDVVIQALKGGSFRRTAAELAGIHRATFYRLIAKDETFRA